MIQKLTFAIKLALTEFTSVTVHMIVCTHTIVIPEVVSILVKAFAVHYSFLPLAFISLPARPGMRSIAVAAPCLANFLHIKRSLSEIQS